MANSISGILSPPNVGAGATVTLSGDADAVTIADGAGSYSFAALLAGDYVVTPSAADTTFVPTFLAETIVADDIADVDFAGSTAPLQVFNVVGAVSTVADLSQNIPGNEFIVIDNGPAITEVPVALAGVPTPFNPGARAQQSFFRSQGIGEPAYLQHATDVTFGLEATAIRFRNPCPGSE